MIKKNHRIKALLLAAYLTLCFHFAPFSASAASQTDTGNLIGERINFLIKNLNGRYFTTDGTSTGNSYNVSVANAHWEPWPFYMDAVLIAMNVGETETILVSVDPNDFSNTQLFGITSWVSEDDSIATVTNGEVTGISAGKTIIHAIASNGKKNDCTVIVREATTQCSVSLCCDGSGAVYGDGLYLIGDFAKVTAVPSWGMTFCGWYQDGILVSSDTEYGFFIMNDAELTAKFAGIDNVSVAIVGTGGSYADIHVFNHEAVDLIVAVYNVEGQMLSVQTRNLQAFEGGDIQINMGIEIIDSAHQVKVFAVSCTKCEPCTTCDSSK